MATGENGLGGQVEGTGAGVVFIPWYATVFRADRLAPALSQVASVALRYGALEYEVFRSRDDRYKFLQSSTFQSKLDFLRYWEGPEFVRFRTDYATWYQVPVIYEWQDRLVRGAIAPVGVEPVEVPL
jgi:hypothetical protein